MKQNIKLSKIMDATARAIIDAEPKLTELDSALGDGDCGQGMKKGFTAVLESLAEDPELDAATVLKKTAMALISSVGGTSGAIYGTAFLKMAAAVPSASGDLNGIACILEAGLNGAKMRGEDTQVGDKTLIDALEPAVYAFKREAQRGGSLLEACKEATKAARAGCDSTVEMIAKKGRASYLGERSKGHRDAGAYGIVVICEAIESCVRDNF